MMLKALRKAADFEAQLLAISKTSGVSHIRVKEETEKYAQENPVSLTEAASVVAGRILRR